MAHVLQQSHIITKCVSDRRRAHAHTVTFAYLVQLLYSLIPHVPDRVHCNYMLYRQLYITPFLC